MKRRVPVYHIACFVIVVLSLFLPYASHDEYTGGWFTSNRQLVANDVMKSGWDYIEVTFVAPVAILLLSTIMVAIRNRATAIIGVIFSFFIILWMPIVAFVLTFNLFGSDDRIQLGYLICVVTVVTYFGFNIGSLVYEVRQYRRNGNRKPNDVVLDDGDLLDDVL